MVDVGTVLVAPEAADVAKAKRRALTHLAGGHRFRRRLRAGCGRGASFGLWSLMLPIGLARYSPACRHRATGRIRQMLKLEETLHE